MVGGIAIVTEGDDGVILVGEVFQARSPQGLSQCQQGSRLVDESP